jgi:ubiquinone/menaquinone biosynthesis C-methylase UbiE/uncharacterized protein YbaR (Trm112 family)
LNRESDLAAVLHCPRCSRGRLALQRAGWICEGCSAGFPIVGGVPWLFAEPQGTLAEWRSRSGLLLLELEREARALRAELASNLAPLTDLRLATVANAYEDHARRLKLLLAPLGTAESKIAYESHLALRTQLPIDQGLTNYYANLHRDWVWGDEENRASLEAIRAVAGDRHNWGRTLIVGAGAGRLAYDIHMHCEPALTVAMDFNPLLLLAAREVVNGGAVQLYEFPISPRTLADHALLRTLQAPGAVREGFFLVAGDATRAPFGENTFDTVVTPWLIDIIDEPLGLFGSRVNRWLVPGGSWLNFGSLAFSHGERSQRLSLEETLEAVAGCGFALTRQREVSMPYMQSPASRHARIENVLTWHAAREREVPSPADFSRLPEWLLRSDLPVPLSPEFQVQALSTRVYAFLMSLIDGKRTVADMARTLVAQRVLSAEEAEPAVRGFLARMHADARVRTGF